MPELELWRVGVERTRLGGVCSAAHGQGHLKSRKSGFWAQQNRVGWQLGLVRLPLRAGLAPANRTGPMLNLKGGVSDRLTLVGRRIVTYTSTKGR